MDLCVGRAFTLRLLNVRGLYWYITTHIISPAISLTVDSHDYDEDEPGVLYYDGGGNLIVTHVEFDRVGLILSK